MNLWLKSDWMKANEQNSMNQWLPLGHMKFWEQIRSASIENQHHAREQTTSASNWCPKELLAGGPGESMSASRRVHSVFLLLGGVRLHSMNSVKNCQYTEAKVKLKLYAILLVPSVHITIYWLLSLSLKITHYHGTLKKYDTKGE